MSWYKGLITGKPLTKTRCRKMFQAMLKDVQFDGGELFADASLILCKLEKVLSPEELKTIKDFLTLCGKEALLDTLLGDFDDQR
jgi:hypothetical protein